MVEKQARDDPKTVNETCLLCGHDYEFRMPPAIVEAAKNGQLVVFAGAGVSTESGTVFPESFYAEIKSNLSTIPKDESFPAVMSAYEAEYGRHRLIEEAVSRIRAAYTFPVLYRMATKFHHELATISVVREIITTNWDSFFEEICDALPIVVDGDYAFYNLPERKVYKIHGSINNVSSIVATLADYQKCESSLRGSAIGGTLRHLLATKIILFVGYSLRDADFRSIYGSLIESIGPSRAPSYIVSPFLTEGAEDLGLRHIKTDGTHFLRSLKAHLVRDDTLLDDKVFDRIRSLYPIVAECHSKTTAMDWRGHPELVFSLAYQDGMLDAIGRIRGRWMTGEYSNQDDLRRLVHYYEHLLRVAVDKARYWDAAYIEGYLNVLLWLIAGNDVGIPAIPLYEFFDPEYFPDESGGNDSESEGVESVDQEGKSTSPEMELTPSSDNADPQYLSEGELVEELSEAVRGLPIMMTEGRALIATTGPSLVPQHPPFLDGVIEPARPAAVE